MIHFKDHESLNIFDPLSFLGPKRKKLMDTSWAKLIGEQILPDLPVDKVFKNYHTRQEQTCIAIYEKLLV